MARPAPRDDQFAPTIWKAYDGSADVDLTAEFTAECPWAACVCLATNNDLAAVHNLVVRFQGKDTTDVTFVIGAGMTVPIRGAFTSIRASTDTQITAVFGWQGGPA